MFQNVINQNIEEQEEKQTRKIDFKNLLKINNIVLYAIACLVSMVGFNKELAPFGLAIFAAVCSNKIPAGILYIAVLIGTAIGFGLSGILTFIISSLLFIAMILIFRPRTQEPNKNEKQKLGIYVAISAFAVQASKMFFTTFLVYDLVVSIMLGIIVYIFYKIFANSLIVINEYGIKKAFSIEEVMGASLIISIALCAFSKLYIFGFSFTNIFSIMLVLFLGWKNGMLVGGTAGITIGMVLGIINETSPILVASYAISGMLAGILNKLGKIGVIVGFCVGNAVLTYIANGNTVPIITIREILIASLGLLVIPKDVSFDITEIINQTKCLPTTAGVIEEKKKTANKLNSVSDTILQMARSYDDSAKDTLNEPIENESKKNFKEEAMNNLEELEDNLLYDDILLNEDTILDEAYRLLEEKEVITVDELIEILERVNNYKLVKESAGEAPEQIVKILNSTYRINKLNTIWKHKEASNKKVLANQLGGVSKVISSLADDIKTEEKPKKINQKYKLIIGSAETTKNKSEMSGDSNAKTKLHDGKYMIAISDGMGSGEKAKKSSSTVIQMLERLLTTGFDNDVSIGLINSAVNLNSNEETYATIDISIIDLSNGNIEFVKNGACPTFIKSNKKVETINAVSFPAGVLDKIDLVVYDKDLKEKDIIIMCSDGILESNTEYKNKELWLKELIENLQTEDVQKIADIILQEAIDNGFGIAKDDMTVIVAKLVSI
jgi:stage II sporulation protein E